MGQLFFASKIQYYMWTSSTVYNMFFGAYDSARLATRGKHEGFAYVMVPTKGRNVPQKVRSTVISRRKGHVPSIARRSPLRVDPPPTLNTSSCASHTLQLYISVSSPPLQQLRPMHSLPWLQRATRRQMVLNMFYLRASEDLSRRSWATILDESFTCIAPLTPYRHFPSSEVGVDLPLNNSTVHSQSQSQSTININGNTRYLKRYAVGLVHEFVLEVFLLDTLPR